MAYLCLLFGLWGSYYNHLTITPNKCIGSGKVTHSQIQMLLERGPLNRACFFWLFEGGFKVSSDTRQWYMISSATGDDNSEIASPVKGLVSSKQVYGLPCSFVRGRRLCCRNLCVFLSRYALHTSLSGQQSKTKT